MKVKVSDAIMSITLINIKDAAEFMMKKKILAFKAV